MAKSTELITIEQVEDVLLHGGELGVVPADAVQEDMVRRILESESAQEAFGGFTAVPASQLEGVPLEVRGIAFMRSAFSEGPQVYALLDCAHADTGEAVTVTMGGRTLMASFVWAMRHKAMPIKGAFKKGKSNTNAERSFWTFDLA